MARTWFSCQHDSIGGQPRPVMLLRTGLAFIHKELGVLARLRWLARKSGLHHAKKLDHSARGRVPVFGLFDLHLQ
jgi:hypothetical protein